MQLTQNAVRVEYFCGLPISQDGLPPCPKEICERDHDGHPCQQARNLQQCGLIQMEGSLHKNRAHQDDRGGNTKYFQSIVSHTQSVGRMRLAAHRTEAYVTFPLVGVDRVRDARAGRLPALIRPEMGSTGERCWRRQRLSFSQSARPSPDGIRQPAHRPRS